MSVLKILIADDESLARNKMKRMLEKFDNIEIIHLAENGLDALENIVKLKPDVAFLDIEMPGLNGIEVVQNLTMDDPPYVVFATAYNEYAINAFDLNAIDYLLKPVNDERLGNALDKIRKLISSGDTAQKEQIEKVAKMTEDESGILPFSNKVPIPTHDRYLLVDFDDIVLIEVQERNTLLHTGEKSYVMNQTLDHFEKKLPKNKFLRVNRSALIGLGHVKEIVIWFGNRFKIMLSNDMDVISSREKSKVLKQVLKF